jgi:hypothetical protein
MYHDDPDDAAFFAAIACVLFFLPLFLVAGVCLNCAGAIGESIQELVAMIRNGMPTAKLSARASHSFLPTSRPVAADHDIADQVISISDAIRFRHVSEPFADSPASKAA